MMRRGMARQKSGRIGRWLGVLLCVFLTVTAPGCQSTADGERRLSLTYRGQELTIGMSEETLVSLVGEESAWEETPSCAGAGVDRLLLYPSLRVYVFAPTNGQAVVRAISYTDDGVQTAQGLHIGSPVDQVIMALGEADAREEGRLYYNGAGTRLVFLFREAHVTGIILEENS